MTPAIRSPGRRPPRRGAGRVLLLACALLHAPGVRAAPDAARPGGQPPQAAPPARPGTGPVERRIARLHAVLRIAPAQEPAWGAFADAMRRNTSRSDEAAEAWRQRDRDGNAVAALRLYGRIEDADAENARSLVAPFGALYDVLSPAQKRTADALVARYVDAQTRRRP